MLRARGTVAMVLGGALAAAGCSTHYMPEPGPRLSTIMQGGRLVYTRDGRKFPQGFTGGGLVDAVANDPQAKQAAETSQNDAIGGLVLIGVGTAALVGSLTTFGFGAADASSSDPSRTTDTQLEVVGGTLFVAALAMMIASSVMLGNAQTYHYDAINIYNDHVDERMRAVAPPGYAPPPGYPLPPRYSLPPGYVPRSAPSVAPAPGSPSSAAPAPSAAPARPPSAAPRGSSAPLPPPPAAPTGVEE